MKIFGIGFQKTGTTTLDQALKVLGYKVTGPNLDLATDMLEGKRDRLYKLADEFDAFQDNPWPLLYEEMDKKYPGSKFILTIRDEEKWIKSVVNHFGKDHTEMRKWIYGYGSPLGHESIYLNRLNAHNKEVQEYFIDRPGDLLVVDWSNGDGWKTLCPFLGLEIPDTPFPHANKGKYQSTLLKKAKTVIKDITGYNRG